MRLVTYNIRYGVGLDGKYDIGRIADAVRGADVIALQEVTRNNPHNGMHDMVEELRAELPDYFSIFGAPFGGDVGSTVENGRAVMRIFEFGNMILSRMPIMTTRNLLLPRNRTFGTLNFQRSALEALIDTPLGPLRFYSVHLDHASPSERIAQLRFLMPRVLGYGLEGGAITGAVELGFPEPAHPEGFVLLGDFNCTPGSPEYQEITGLPDAEFGLTRRVNLPFDASLIGDPDHAERITFVDPKLPDAVARRCLDYCFVHAGLTQHVKKSWIDTEAMGSDHQPVWTELV
jgi:endonuclease/exonuclease/phosphatase family metal-dependent hydrolase